MLVNCPAYYSVSAPKAELLNKIKAMPEEVNEEEEQADINEKKVKKEWGPLRCSPRKRVLAGLLVPYSSGGWGRGKACDITNLPEPSESLHVQGPWSRCLTAVLSLSFLQMAKVKG